MPYPAFSVKDFCKDPHFIGWVTNPTAESNRFWQAFLADYPHKATDVQTAIEYVQTIQFREINPSPQDLARLKKRIWADIEPDRRWYGTSTESAPRPIRVLPWYRQPHWAAAAVLLVIVSVGLNWWVGRSSLTYRTAFGKIQAIHLADGSVVTLNANSSLRVADNLLNAPIREVWLVGEAYFDIAKRTGATFIVHTADAEVAVLGTEFNVNTRRQQTNVVLHEGKVQLSTDNQSVVVMAPGDMATITPKSRQIQLKRVQPDRYDAWKESYIVLDDKTLPEIVSAIEDTFGITVTIENARLLNKKLTGKLQTTVPDDCIENLAVIIEADVKKAGNRYSFR